MLLASLGSDANASVVIVICQESLQKAEAILLFIRDTSIDRQWLGMRPIVSCQTTVFMLAGVIVSVLGSHIT